MRQLLRQNENKDQNDDKLEFLNFQTKKMKTKSNNLEIENKEKS